MIMKKNILLLFLTFIFIQQLFSQSWTQKPDFPGNIRYNAVAFSIDSFGYAGLGSSPSLERDFWRYDPSTETWSQIDSFPAPGRVGAVSFVINGKAYVVGGDTFEGESRNDTWEFDPSTNTWTQKSDIPVGLITDSNLFAFSVGNYGYVKANFNRPNDFFQYDPETDSWTVKANYPGGYYIIDEVAFSINEKGYIGSGFKQTESTNEFWEYDPKFNTWKRIADLPGEPRNNAIAFTIDGYGYVGLGNIKGIVVNDFWKYNPGNNSWTKVDSCGYSAMGAFAFSINDRGYVGTGLYSTSSEFWQYKPIVDHVASFAQNQEFVVYPNPAKNSITVSNPLNNKIKKIELIDLSGRTIRQWDESGYGGNVFELESVLPGIYLLKIETEFEINTEKLVVQ